MRHEIKHHLNAVALYIKQRKYQEAENYINSVTESINDLTIINYTPNPLINSILTEYKIKAKKLEIKVNYDIVVPEHINMEDTDICRLITNIFDNALEACTFFKYGDRFINFKIHRKGEFLFLSCENSCNTSKIKYSGDNIISTKNDPQNHGYGLKIIKEIAEKYNGTFIAKTNINSFTTIVNMCLFNNNF